MFGRILKSGIYLSDQDLNISVSGNAYEYPLVIGTNPDLDGSFTEYPLVVGISDTIIFSPRDSSVMFNLDYEDSSKSSYVLKATSQFTPTDFANYGILTNVENDIFKLQFTDRRIMLVKP